MTMKNFEEDFYIWPLYILLYFIFNLLLIRLNSLSLAEDEDRMK